MKKLSVLKRADFTERLLPHLVGFGNGQDIQGAIDGMAQIISFVENGASAQRAVDRLMTKALTSASNKLRGKRKTAVVAKTGKRKYTKRPGVKYGRAAWKKSRKKK